jgi:hypothetical protein
MSQTIRDIAIRMSLQMDGSNLRAPQISYPGGPAPGSNGGSAYPGGSSRPGAGGAAGANGGYRPKYDVEHEWKMWMVKYREMERAEREADRRREQAARLSETAAKRQVKANLEVTKSLLGMGEGAINVARGIALMAATSERDSEKMIRGFARVMVAADMARGGFQLVGGLVRAGQAVHEARKAAAAAPAAGGSASGIAGLLRFGPHVAAGVVGAGALLGGGAAFSKSMREGLGELTGFSDMAGDERKRVETRMIQGQLYNELQSIERQRSLQRYFNASDRAGVNRGTWRGGSAMSAADQLIPGLSDSSLGIKEQLQLVDRLASAQARVADVVQQELRMRREGIQATREQLELHRRTVSSEAMRFLGMTSDERNRTIRGLSKVQSGGQLSRRELEAVFQFPSALGQEGAKIAEAQAINMARAKGLNLKAADDVQKNLEYQLKAQQDALSQAHDMALKYAEQKLGQSAEKFGDNLLKMFEAIDKKYIDSRAEAGERAAEAARGQAITGASAQGQPTGVARGGGFWSLYWLALTGGTSGGFDYPSRPYRTNTRPNGR